MKEVPRLLDEFSQPDALFSDHIQEFMLLDYGACLKDFNISCCEALILSE